MTKRHGALKSSLVLAVAVATGCATPTPGAVGGAPAASTPNAAALQLQGGNGLISNNAGGLISNNAGGLISNNAGGLISNNAGGLISNNAGGLISNNAGGLISNNAGGLISNNAGGLTGAVRGPAAGLISNNAGGLISNNAGGLISNNAGGLISNNAGGLISNNAGGLISNNAGGYRLYQAASTDAAVEGEAATAPVAGAKCAVFNDRGEMISYNWVTTDEDGNYTFAKLKASGPLLFVKAVYEREGHQVTLVSTAPAPRQAGMINVAVTPATTIIAKKFSEMIRLNAVRPENLRPSMASKLSKALAPVLTAKAVVAAAIFTDARAADTFDHIMEEAPPVLTEYITNTAAASNVAAAVDDTPDTKLPTPAPAPIQPPTPAQQAEDEAEFPVDTSLPGEQPSGGNNTPSNPSNPSNPSDPEPTTPETPSTPVSTLTATVVTVGLASGKRVEAEPGTGNAFFPSDSGLKKASVSALTATGLSALTDSGTGATAVAFDGGVRYELEGDKIITSGGATTTITGQDDATFEDIAVKAGVAYLTSPNKNAIYKVDLGTGAATKLAGEGSNIGNYKDAVGAEARFKAPVGIVASATALYVADRGNARIRKITFDGTVTTVAGIGANGTYADGSATTARFASPMDLTLDAAAGVLYVADQSANRIRKVALADGTVTTVSGSGQLAASADGTGGAATFYFPTSISLAKVGGTQVLLVGDADGKIRAVTGW